MDNLICYSNAYCPVAYINKFSLL